MKQVLCIVLVMCLMVSVLSMQAFAEDDSSNGRSGVTWRYDEASKTLVIGGTGEMPDLCYESFGLLMYEQPWGDFSNSIKIVDIGDSVTSIGGCAFCNCDGLLKVSIPDSVTSIGLSAFNGCDNLSTVSMGNSVSYIADYAFYECYNLNKISLPASVTSIGNGAFYWCSSLNEISLPDSVTSVGEETFFRCYNLDKVHFGNGITSIGKRAFYECYNIENIGIPSSVVSIGEEAFYNCWNLFEIGIPDSVTSVGERAFYSCDDLVAASVGDSVTSVESETFAHCNKLEYVYLGNSVSLIEDSAFSNCESLQWVNNGNSLTSIGDNAFYKCKSLYKIKFPKSLTTIGKNAFFDCDSLVYFYLPNQIDYIDSGAFRGCDNLRYIFYCGSEEQWNEIAIASNAIPSNVEIIFDCVYPCDHVEVIDEAVEATCIKTGLTEGTHCSECGEILKNQEVTPVSAHQWKNGKCVVCGEPMSNPFHDVSESDWFYNPVMWAVGNGVTGGTSATTFGPNDSCTRAQVVTFLWAANGKPEPKSMDNPFTDVADDAWYLKPVLWAVENGITGGVAEGKFGPDQTCTRAQIVTFLYAAAGKPEVSGESAFGDVSNDAWYLKSVLWAAQNDVTGGVGEDKFGPNNTCTRGQVVTFLYKVYGSK